MTEPPRWYEFRHERAHRALIDAAGGFRTPDDIGEEWDELVSDGSETALVLSEVAAIDLVSRITSGALDGTDPRHSAWHADALERLTKHDDCEQVLHRLTCQRDNVVTSLWSARSYAFNDMYEGEYGDLYLSVEPFLDQLRPGLPENQVYLPLSVLDRQCEECYEVWSHDEDCSIGQHGEMLAERRSHAFASHLHCAEMGAAVIAHTARCLERAEDIATQAIGLTEVVYGDRVVDPHDVLEVLLIENLNVALDPGDPTTIATHIYPPLEDLPYCGSEWCDHSDPHRACRFLIS